MLATGTSTGFHKYLVGALRNANGVGGMTCKRFKTFFSSQKGIKGKRYKKAIRAQQEQKIVSNPRPIIAATPPPPSYKSQGGKNVDPAFLILGLFPIIATGTLVLFRDDLREQVMENWKTPQKLIQIKSSKTPPSPSSEN